MKTLLLIMICYLSACSGPNPPQLDACKNMCNGRVDRFIDSACVCRGDLK